MRQMRSCCLAQSFAQDMLFSRAADGNALLVIVRSVKDWNLPDHPNVISHASGKARGAHLTMKSISGRYIFIRLCSAYERDGERVMG